MSEARFDTVQASCRVPLIAAQRILPRPLQENEHRIHHSHPLVRVTQATAAAGAAMRVPPGNLYRARCQRSYNSPAERKVRQPP